VTIADLASPLWLLLLGTFAWIVFFCTCITRSSRAEGRAAALLREWLSPSQRSQYERNHYFDVRGSSSGKRYRICQGRSGNVIELDEFGAMAATLCFHPEGELALGDVMLAQKIALEADEIQTLAVANRTPAYRR
jgi:hypothetical protein